MNSPETHYVTVGGAQVAYQVAGDGSEDLTICLPLGGQIDGFWQLPPGPELLGGLRHVRRLIAFDRRGSGASDPLSPDATPTWEEMAEDLLAVLDDAGSERTALIGVNDTGPIAVLFAAMHPERVSHLNLWTTTARWMAADDYPFGMSSETVDVFVDYIGRSWATEEFSQMGAPTRDPEERAAWRRMLRSSATPRSAAKQWDYILRSVDVRGVLPAVQAPTLIFHASDSPILPIEHGRYLAEHLPNAKLIEWETSGFQPPDPVQTTSEMIEFITGQRPADVDRILATVLFTDIVGSTERAAALGDQRWHGLLDSHDRAIREQVRRFGGREIKTTGDGFFVSFDGPARAIRCALAISEALRPLNIDLRMGLHTGECEVRGDDLGGLAIHIAARIAALATSQEILVSSTLKDLVLGSGIEFTDRGEFDLKGVPGTWRLFAVAG
jgi:class 3 adenylate cyclase/pimeloyl-ACP methyl ester carboxylesterase